MGKLATELHEKSSNSKKNMSADVKKVVDRSMEILRKKDLVETSLKVGDQLPAIALENHEGNIIDVNELVKNGPVIVTFYRGGWCPYCNMELAAYQSMMDAFTELSVQVVAISPEMPSMSERLSTKLELGFHVLSDRENKVAKSFGIVYEYDEKLKDLYRKVGVDLAELNGDWNLPLPATYLVSQEGSILLRDVDIDYTVRMDPEDILAYLEEHQA